MWLMLALFLSVQYIYTANTIYTYLDLIYTCLNNYAGPTPIGVWEETPTLITAET